jgi:ryanodine receptor 2
MMDLMGQEIAFKGIDVSEPLLPAFSLGAGQHAKINFGQVRIQTRSDIELGK